MDIIDKLIANFKKSKTEQIECKELYDKYFKLCLKRKEKPINRSYFGRAVRKELDRIRVRDDNKLKWVYVVPSVPIMSSIKKDIDESVRNIVEQEIKKDIGNNMDKLMDHISYISIPLYNKIKKWREAYKNNPINDTW